MAASTWTAGRLTRLFERYRRLYWPRSRRLTCYRIESADLGDVYGRCDCEARLVQMNVSIHASDREIRSTLLHEMIHAALDRPGRSPGHRAPFWREMEALLVRRAPITVGFEELGECGSALGIIPHRFRRCRERFRRVHDREQRRIEQLVAGMDAITVTPRMVETECFDWALEGALWRAIWNHQARTNGFVDLDGRVLPWARQFQRACRRGYLRGLQAFRDEQRVRQRFEAARALKTEPVTE